MNPDANDEMRTEYDFSEAVQGKHHDAYERGTNLVLLEPDVARFFRDSAAVNKALRSIMVIAREAITNNAQQSARTDPPLRSRSTGVG